MEMVFGSNHWPGKPFRHGLELIREVVVVDVTVPEEEYVDRIPRGRLRACEIASEGRRRRAQGKSQAEEVV